MLKSKSKFYYSRLDNTAKRIYNVVLSALEARNSNPSFMVNPLASKPDIQKILQYISHDNPGLFYVDFSHFLIRSSLTSVSLQINFLYNNRQIDAPKCSLIVCKVCLIVGFICYRSASTVSYFQSPMLRFLLSKLTPTFISFFPVPFQGSR